MTMTLTAGTPAVHAVPAAPSRGRLRPLGPGEVRITDGFWAERQHVNATATLPHIAHWLEHEGWAVNFDLAAAGGLPAGRRGREFSDSEVYKFLEALAWEIGRSGAAHDDATESRFRALVARVAAAQEPDGYLNTAFGRPGQPPRWSDLEWGHELYCFGHLFQAAVARARTRPAAGDGLLDVARRAADLVCDVFGPDGIRSVCGHPGIEPALAELSRVTGEPRYLAQAALFVERRGHGVLRDIEWGRAYFQDDVPVRAATVLRGHAVRAGYLSAGAVDVAVEQADDELLAALSTQWENTVARRTYVTGGQGSHHQDEAFGDDWVLPPDRAYSETCAAVASVMFGWRLLLAQGLPRYADLIERTLFNVVATSPSREGTAFYYTNTLHQRRAGVPAPEGVVSPRAASSLRAPWFEVSCCPPNVARTLASLSAYVATADDEGLQLHQYAGAQIRTALPDGRTVAIDVETAYPRDGVVRVVVRADAGAPWTLTLRVPAWAAGARVVLRPAAGEATAADAEPGSTTVRRAFRAGDVVELHLPMEPRVSAADPRIDAVRGCVVVERGPEVLCLESVDLAAATGGRIDDVADARVDASSPPAVVDGEVRVRVRPATAPARPWPYGEAGEDAGTEAFDVPLVPYHDWAERGPSTMRVWLPLARPGR
jgi:DUF1680 family protein